VGEYAATLLTLFAQAPRQAEQCRVRREKLTTRKSAVNYCARLLNGEKREKFYVVCLNGQMETLGNALIAQGSISDVPAYPRLVVDAVLTETPTARCCATITPAAPSRPRRRTWRRRRRSPACFPRSRWRWWTTSSLPTGKR
jgi:DNA repair protein RadC